MKTRMPGSVLCILVCAGCALNGSLDASGAEDEPATAELEATGLGAAVADCSDLLPFSPSNFDPCDLGPVSPPLDLNALSDEFCGVYLLDTDTGMLSVPCGGTSQLAGDVIEQKRGPDLFVVTTSSFSVASQSILDIDGSRALVVVSTGSISLQGDVFGDGTFGGSGPGGDDNRSCRAGRGRNGTTMTRGGATAGGSGGGGGGFAAQGGTGAEVSGAENAAETRAGRPRGSANLVPLRGGCAGGDGGMPGGFPVSEGGGGGGALQFVAGGNLSVGGSAVVTVSAGGGDPVNVPAAALAGAAPAAQFCSRPRRSRSTAC